MQPACICLAAGSEVLIVASRVCRVAEFTQARFCLNSPCPEPATLQTTADAKHRPSDAPASHHAGARLSWRALKAVMGEHAKRMAA
jgi:hypothetical protein